MTALQAVRVVRGKYSPGVVDQLAQCFDGSMGISGAAGVASEVTPAAEGVEVGGPSARLWSAVTLRSSAKRLLDPRRRFVETPNVHRQPIVSGMVATKDAKGVGVQSWQLGNGRRGIVAVSEHGARAAGGAQAGRSPRAYLTPTPGGAGCGARRTVELFA